LAPKKARVQARKSGLMADKIVTDDQKAIIDSIT